MTTLNVLLTPEHKKQKKINFWLSLDWIVRESCCRMNIQNFNKSWLTLLPNREENKSNSRHNVKGSFL